MREFWILLNGFHFYFMIIRTRNLLSHITTRSNPYLYNFTWYLYMICMLIDLWKLQHFSYLFLQVLNWSWIVENFKKLYNFIVSIFFVQKLRIQSLLSTWIISWCIPIRYWIQKKNHETREMSIRIIINILIIICTIYI